MAAAVEEVTIQSVDTATVTVVAAAVEVDMEADTEVRNAAHSF